MIYNTLHKFKLSHIIDRNLVTEKSWLFRLVYQWIKKINISKKVIRNGKSFTIFIKNGMGFMNFVSKYESWLDEVLPKLIDKDDAVFIDVGANTGQTLLKVFSLFPKVQYYAIEPNLHCVQYLQQLCETNHLNSVEIKHCALSDTEGEGELLSRYKDDMMATTSPKFRKFTKYAIKTKVPMTTGDALFSRENLKEISVIKIDVEGGEAEVVNGLYNTIKSFQPLIICEILPVNSEDSSITDYRIHSANKILKTLKELDYTILNIAKKKQIHEVQDLSSSLESSNYLCMPYAKGNLKL